MAAAKNLKLRHFESFEEVVAYVFDELTSTLADDLDRMTRAERAHYTNADRQDMRSRIADIRKVQPVVGDVLTLFDESLGAWEDEEDSVKEEHAELIGQMQEASKLMSC